MLVTLLSFFGVLLVLVVIHELGHFITAKMAGVTVQEFGVGYPPRLYAYRFRGTEYSINLLPLGGFVKLLGEEDPNETARGDTAGGAAAALLPGGAAGAVTDGKPEVTLASKSAPVRIGILAAGALMNAVLPVVLFSASYMLPQDVVTGAVKVQDVIAGSPAAVAGIRTGDTIIRINDRTVQRIQDVGYSIQLNLGAPIEVAVKRAEGDHTVVHLTPRWNPPVGEGATGIVIVMPEVTTATQALPIWEAVPKAVRQSFDMVTLFKNGIISMFTNSNPQARQVAGPVGIAQMTGEVAKAGIPSLLEWSAFLSMNLAIFNLLPIPMLDGGRIFFVLLEVARGGRRIPPEREGVVHMVGFVLLMTFVVVVSINDIVRIFSGESFFR